MTPFDKFHDLQCTIETQRCQLIHDGGSPDAVLIGPWEWRIIDNYVLALSRQQGLESALSVPTVTTLDALTIIRTQGDGVTVVQTWETPRRARRPFNPEPTDETP